MSGSLTDAFSNAGVNNRLVTVDVSHNVFTGSLPVALFNSTSLKEFIGGTNCFEGSIASEVCLAAKLRTFDLSGMTAGDNCVERFGFPFDFYRAKTVPGVIPACLFSLKSLFVLSLSGNGIRSPLVELPADSSLLNVSLSYNRIFGSIPVSMKQYNGFAKLDLAYNQLSGTLEGVTWYQNGSESQKLEQNDTILRLKSNRISGAIPSSFDSASHISVLNGNLFQCVDKSTLPQNDTDISNYICGSDLSDLSLFGFTATVMARIALCVVCMYGLRNWSSGARASVEMWELLWSGTHGEVGSDSRDLEHLDSMLRRLRWFLTCLLGCILLVLLPLFLGLKATSDYSSHTYQYGWRPSLGFMQHQVPATTVFALYVVIVPALAWFDVELSKPFRNMDTLTGSHSARQPDSQEVATVKSRLLVMGLIVNIVVVVIVNGAYVYVVLTQSVALQVTLIIITSAFKLFWSFGVVNTAMRMLNSSMWLLVSLTVVNNIILPAIGTALVDIACFQKLFIRAAEVSNTLVIENYLCSGYARSFAEFSSNYTCVDEPLILGVSYEPPFIYSGQCSDSLLSNYVPVYVFMFGIASTLLQLLQLGVLCYFSDLETTTENEDVRSRWLRKFKSNLQVYEIATLGVVSFRVLPIVDSDDLTGFNSPVCVSMYKLRELGVTCVLCLLFLVTYGSAYPVFGVVLIVDVVLATLLRQLCIIRHFRQLKDKRTVLLVWLAGLRHELDHFRTVVYAAKPGLIVVTAVFISLFLYDMRVAEGSSVAIVYSVLLSCWGLVVSLLYYLYDVKTGKDLNQTRQQAVSRRSATLKPTDVERAFASNLNKDSLFNDSNGNSTELVDVVRNPLT